MIPQGRRVCYTVSLFLFKPYTIPPWSGSIPSPSYPSAHSVLQQDNNKATSNPSCIHSYAPCIWSILAYLIRSPKSPTLDHFSETRKQPSASRFAPKSTHPTRHLHAPAASRRTLHPYIHNAARQCPPRVGGSARPDCDRRARRLRHMPGRLLGRRDGLLRRRGLHLGRYHGRHGPGLHHRL